MQIGNAVPPLMAKGIAKEIKISLGVGIEIHHFKKD